MKVVLKNGREQDCSREIGELLIAADLAVEATSPPAPSPRTLWQVARGVHSGQLILTANCSTCLGGLCVGGPNATKEVFIHCRTREICPPTVAHEYREAFLKEQENEKPAQQPKQPSAMMRMVEMNDAVGDASATTYTGSNPGHEW